MKLNTLLFVFLFSLTLSQFGHTQVNGDKLGAWYMYFWNTKFNESNFGLQGDVQYRNWNFIGDLEQLLLRGGLTYTPKTASITFTLGYAHITTGAFGSDEDDTTQENRIYQEALFPSKLGTRFYFTHRLRYEQRFVEDQDFRTRYRYNLFLNVPFNNQALTRNTYYLALYNEIFINGERQIGNGNEVEVFDRNRSYFGVGYAIKSNLRVQLGYMRQSTDSGGKNQWQFSLHHTI
ncbi:MAG: DUF2490 domain-containing protein [Bacteroidota bacterium]